MLNNLEDNPENQFSISKVFDIFSECIHYAKQNHIVFKYILIIQTILVTTFEISILFQPEIITNQDIYISILIESNSIIDLSLIEQTQSQLFLVAQSITIAVMLSCIIINTLFYTSSINNHIFYMLVIYSNKFFNVMSIPIFYMCIGCLFNKSGTINIITIILEIVFTVFFFVHLFFIKFNFDPVLKQNKYFKSKTDYDFYSYIFWFVKIMFVKAYHLDFNMLCIILYFEIARIILINDRSHPELALLEKMPAYFNIIIAICIIINTYSNNAIEFELVSTILIVCLLIGFILKFQRINGKSIKELKNCKNIVQEDFRQFIYSWQIKLTSEKNKQFNERLYKGFIRKHSESCMLKNCFMKQTNFVNEDSNKSTAKAHFQKFVLGRLEYLSRKSQDFAILYLQKLYQYKQSGEIKSFNLKITNYCYLFIVYHIKKMNNFNEINQDFNDIQENYIQLKKMFYIQMKKVVFKLKTFFTELKQKRPSLNLLEEYGHQSYNQIEQLKKIYDKINMNQRTDLRIIEFYLQFLKNFMKDDAQVEQTIKKAKKKILSKYKDSCLEESSIATISVNIKEGGFIINMNCQAMKVLRCHIVQINDRKILDFLLPIIDPSSFQNFFMSIINKPVACLLKTLSKQMIPVKISSRIRQNLYNKQYYLQINCINQLKQAYYILITKEITLDPNFMEQGIYFDLGLKLSFTEFFEQFIKPKFHILQSRSHIQVYQQNGVRVIATLQQTVHTQSYMMKLLIKKQSNNIRDNDKIVKNTFSFKVAKANDKIIINGDKNDNNQISLSFEKGVQSNKDSKDTVFRNYSKGIKLYRVYGQQLYNIQLENLKSQVQMCMHQQQDLYEQSKRSQRQKNIIQCIYIILFLILVLILVVSFINYFIRISIINSDIYNIYQKQNRVHYFEILYYRILNILSDVQIPVAKYTTPYNWTSQIRELISQVKLQQKSLLFNNSQFTIYFDKHNYTTCTDEFMNIFLSKILEIVNNDWYDLIQEIHILFATTFFQNFEIYKRNLQQNISAQIQNYRTNMLISIIVFIFLYILQLILLMSFSYLECEKRKNILLIYRIKSDVEIESILQKLERLTIILELSTKHQQIDLFEMFDDKKQFAKREKPKQLSNKLVEFSPILIVIIVFTLAVVIFYVYTYIATINFSDHLLNFLKLSNSVVQCYIGIQRIAPVTTFLIDFDEIELMQKGLTLIEKNRFNLPFSSEFSTYINTLFFSDSCDFVRKISPNLNCDNYGLTYSVENPFSNGFLSYFHLVHFQLSNNATNTRPAVGGISYPFQQLFLNISNQSRIEWSQNINSIIYNQQIYLTIHFLFLILMLGMIILFSWSKSKEVQNSEKIKDIIKQQEVIVPNTNFKSIKQ